MYVYSPVVGTRSTNPAPVITWAGSSSWYALKSPSRMTSSPLAGSAWMPATNPRRLCACSTRSALKKPCRSAGSGSVLPSGRLFDLKWLATTVNVEPSAWNVCAIGSRAMSHTVSSTSAKLSPTGVTDAGW